MIHILRVVRLKHENLVTWSHQVHNRTAQRADRAIGDKDLRIRAQSLIFVAVSKHWGEVLSNLISEKRMTEEHSILIVLVVANCLSHIFDKESRRV